MVASGWDCMKHNEGSGVFQTYTLPVLRLILFAVSMSEWRRKAQNYMQTFRCINWLSIAIVSSYEKNIEGFRLQVHWNFIEHHRVQSE
jgi:hypothetical protein